MERCEDTTLGPRRALVPVTFRVVCVTICFPAGSDVTGAALARITPGGVVEEPCKQRDFSKAENVIQYVECGVQRLYIR